MKMNLLEPTGAQIKTKTLIGGEIIVVYIDDKR